MVESPPGASLEVVEPDLTLELLEVAFHTPPELDQRNELSERGALRQSREAELEWSLLLAGVFDDQPDGLERGTSLLGVLGVEVASEGAQRNWRLLCLRTC